MNLVSTTLPRDRSQFGLTGYTQFDSEDEAKAQVTKNKAAATREANKETAGTDQGPETSTSTTTKGAGSNRS